MKYNRILLSAFIYDSLKFAGNVRVLLGDQVLCDPTEEYRIFLKKSRKLIRWDIRSVMTTARFFGNLHFSINGRRTALAVVSSLLLHFVD